MYLLMDKDSRLAMTTLNGVNDFFVKLGDMFNAYLEQKREWTESVGGFGQDGAEAPVKAVEVALHLPTTPHQLAQPAAAKKG